MGRETSRCVEPTFPHEESPEDNILLISVTGGKMDVTKDKSGQSNNCCPGSVMETVFRLSAKLFAKAFFQNSPQHTNTDQVIRYTHQWLKQSSKVLG